MTNNIILSEILNIDWLYINKFLEIPKGNNNCILEWAIPSTDFEMIKKSQSCGFLLVDTEIEFETLVEQIVPTSKITRKATLEDLKEIQNIAIKTIVTNNKFVNKYSNCDYLTTDNLVAYYNLFIKNLFYRNDAIIIVAEDKLGICGYLVLEKNNSLDLYEKYSGIIAGVLERSKGQNLLIKMQNYFTELNSKPYLLVNRTNLANYKLIELLMNEKRQLSKIDHVFLKKCSTK
jgi:hypothetical protein